MYRADATKRVPPVARFCQHHNGETVERVSIQCLSVCRTTMTVSTVEFRVNGLFVFDEPLEIRNAQHLAEQRIPELVASSYLFQLPDAGALTAP